MKRLRIITTGGTIDKVYFDAKSEFQIGEPQILGILHEAQVDFTCELTALMRKDSLEITDADRELIVRAVESADERHIIVTHGTDTMADTAAALARIPDKTIVLVGALNPARFRSSDALFNIGMAVAAVQTMPPGVYVTMNGRVFEAGHVRKNREQNRFEEV